MAPPTLNKGKVFNWVYICNAIMNYAYSNRNEIANFDSLKGLDLNTVLDFTYSEKLSNILKEYVSYRKELMLTMDRIGDAELKNDLNLVTTFI
jgi:VIT1/CCC1 family predicted Fe2+/Mn2+ transporter